jgi:hypothetical protein
MTSFYDRAYFHRELEDHFHLHEMVDTIQRMTPGPEKDEGLALWRDGHHQIPVILDSIGVEVLASRVFIATYLNSKISGLAVLDAIEKARATVLHEVKP